jgi:hypothetical protein
LLFSLFFLVEVEVERSMMLRRQRIDLPLCRSGACTPCFSFSKQGVFEARSIQRCGRFRRREAAGKAEKKRRRPFFFLVFDNGQRSSKSEKEACEESSSIFFDAPFFFPIRFFPPRSAFPITRPSKPPNLFFLALTQLNDLILPSSRKSKGIPCPENPEMTKT